MKKKLVVLTGAGISAESGLQTFRDSDGLWMGYDIRDVATPEAFKKDPALVLDFYNMRRRNVLEAEPNEAHIALAKLEEHYNVTIITQNIDDLHERAGSTHVIHLHGSIFKMFSVGSPQKHVEIKGDINLGDMGEDGTQYRPQIVWFNEPVPLIETAASILEKSDIFILVGSSLQVYPAAGLIHYVPSEVPKYIVDKKIPEIHPIPNLFLIEEKATEGMRLLLGKLV